MGRLGRAVIKFPVGNLVKKKQGGAKDKRHAQGTEIKTFRRRTERALAPPVMHVVAIDQSHCNVLLLSACLALDHSALGALADR